MIIIQAIFERIAWLFTYAGVHLFSSFKIISKQNLKGLERPLLIIANHRSLWDPFIIGTLFPFFSTKYLPIGFMVNDRYYKWLRPFFWLTRSFPANRGKGLDVSLKVPRRILSSGGVFLIFPAGQRHYLGRAPRPKRGAAVLALEMLWLNILPIYLNTVSCWSIKDFLLRRKSIKVAVGKSFKLKEKTNSRNVNEVARVLADEIFKLS